MCTAPTTPFQVACFFTQSTVLQYLIENGAIAAPKEITECLKATEDETILRTLLQLEHE